MESRNYGIPLNLKASQSSFKVLLVSIKTCQRPSTFRECGNDWGRQSVSDDNDEKGKGLMLIMLSHDAKRAHNAEAFAS